MARRLRFAAILGVVVTVTAALVVCLGVQAFVDDTSPDDW